jgi:hypothetical protein
MPIAAWGTMEVGAHDLAASFFGARYPIEANLDVSVTAHGRRNGMNIVTRWLGLSLVLALLLSSCAADSVLVGTGGSGSKPDWPSAVPRLAALRAMQQAAGHDFVRESDALIARIQANREEARVAITGDRIEVTRVDRSFSLGVRILHVGRRGQARRAPPVTSMRAEGREAVLEREGVEERYFAGPLGLEQSFRIEARPQGAGPLMIEVAFDGLLPKLAEDAENVVLLRDEAGTTRAVYRDVSAVDAESREIAAHIELTDAAVTLVVDDATAVYPIVVDPLLATQEAVLVPLDSAPSERFGNGISVSGDTALLGSHGAAYIFVRAGGTWAQQAKLVVPGDTSFFAWVSLSGDTAAVRGNNLVYVFVRSGSTWTQQATLASNPPNENFGNDLSVSGDTLLVGAPWAVANGTQTGAVYVFTRTGAVWTQQAKLLGQPHEAFGASVSVSGDTAAIGAPQKQGATSYGNGIVYVYVRNGAAWVQQAQILPMGVPSGAGFGSPVRLSGDTFVTISSAVGANMYAFVYQRSAGAWAQSAGFLVQTGWLGAAYADISGDTLVLGAPYWGYPSYYPGRAQVALRTGSTWTIQATLLAGDGADGDQFGQGVGVDGSKAIAIIGATSKNNASGVAYAFTLGRANGDPCSDPQQCSSAFCVDGVCCNTVCGASQSDCQACSLAAGAPVDGTCAPISGAPCSDGDACSQGDACSNGTCIPGASVTCLAIDACHSPGLCQSATGQCTSPAKADGTACNDGNACTQSDTCEAGACTGASPVVCAAQDECHDAGSCDPTTGACTSPAKADGSPCAGGACMSGVCTGSPSSSSGSAGGGGATNGSGGAAGRAAPAAR